MNRRRSALELAHSATGSLRESASARRKLREAQEMVVAGCHARRTDGNGCGSNGNTKIYPRINKLHFVLARRAPSPCRTALRGRRAPTSTVTAAAQITDKDWGVWDHADQTFLAHSPPKEKKEHTQKRTGTRREREGESWERGRVRRGKEGSSRLHRRLAGALDGSRHHVGLLRGARRAIRCEPGRD